MDTMDIPHLIDLLDQPELLQKEIAQLRSKTNNSEELIGFIVLYDQLNGDPTAIKRYFKESEVEFEKKVRTPFQIIPIFPLFQKVAVILVLILCIGGVFYATFNSQNETKDLSLNEKKTFSKALSTNVHPQIEQALHFFKNKNYHRTITSLKSLSPTIAKSDTIRYLLAVSYFHKKKYSEASTLFKTISQGEFKDKSIYYLGIIGLKLKHPKTVVKSLVISH
jgi:TolA-binding protein